jgi:diguanylate cyclase (GGDEF)-like protein/PAS domain S-box-containing protein
MKTHSPRSFKKKYQESEERYQALVDHLPVGLYRTTSGGRIIEANPALAKMLGYEGRADLMDVNVKSLYVNARERERHLARLEACLTEFAEFRLKRKNGTTIWGRDYCRALRGPDGRIKYYDGILVDITEAKKAERKLKGALQKLESLSLEDELTGLYNRRGFFSLAGSHIELANRRKSLMFMLFMDLDDLKEINDTFGHGQGDAALIDLAGILVATFRKSDIKARIGGDEFAVFPVGSTREGVGAAISRMEANVAAFNGSGDRDYKLSVSTGISVFDPQAPCSLDELVRRADKVMYEKKSLKRTRQPK